MNERTILIIVALLVFGGFSAWVLVEEGYIAIWQASFMSPATMQVLFDLVIACMVFMVWMIKDASARGISPLPWMIAIVATGSIAILVYLLVREWQKKAQLQVQ